MPKFKGMMLAAVTLAALTAAPPAYADFCLQLNGGSFSGDIGFFRFKKSRPTGSGAIVALKGRAAGLSPVPGVNYM